MGAPDAIGQALDRARGHAALARDEAAKQAYVDVLHLDPTNLPALNELGALACASGHRSAARSAYAQSVRHHPGNPVGCVALGNLLAEDGDFRGARRHYQAALDAAPALPEAHQGMARALAELGEPGAEGHWQKGFAGHAVAARRYRGAGPGVPLLLLVSARGGNIPTRPWIDDRFFAVTAIYADFHDPAQALPPHDLVVNAIGDADLCDLALRHADAMLTRGAAPVVNPPARVRATGREANARRLGRIPGVTVPSIEARPRRAILAGEAWRFPLLLRAPGFHTGRHFVRVDDRDGLADAVAELPGDELLEIEYLDATGPDGLARKYRVMFIDGACYPLHLAISADWKVHYFTAAMAADPSHRDEERRFLDDMPTVLGGRAMAALAEVCTELALDYAGVDFAVAPDGSVLLFEANATMVIVPPGPDPIWDYRRRAAAAAQQAARQMLLRRAPSRRTAGFTALAPAARPGDEISFRY